jgi:hypothetical protein
MKLYIGILSAVLIILFVMAIFSSRYEHVKLEVHRIGSCGENGVGTQLCDVLFTNGSTKRITRGPQVGDSVWVTIPVEEAP